MLGLLVIVSVTVILAWVKARDEVKLPAAWEQALVAWREGYETAKIHKLVLRTEDAERRLVSALAELHRTPGGAGRILLQVTIPVTRGEEGRMLSCLRRRFPEVEFLAAQEGEERGL